MNSKTDKLVDLGIKVAFALLLVYSGITIYLKNYIIGGIQLFVAVLIFVVYIVLQRRRRRLILNRMSAMAEEINKISSNTLASFTIPVMVMKIDNGEIIWGNQSFFDASGISESPFEMHVSSAIPGFDARWLLEGKPNCPYDIEMGEKKYTAYGIVTSDPGSSKSHILATIIFFDITNYAELRDRYDKSRPVVAVIVLDSYAELYNGRSEAERSILNAAIDEKITAWAAEADGVIRRLERDRYIFVFEQKDLVKFIAGKFTVLEDIRQIKNAEGITASLSIGIGQGDLPMEELHKFALLGIDMALSRGGDQVVIKTKSAFEFYGGRNKEVEKRTKVKSRVMANALSQLIQDSSYVFIMGHKFSDLDSIGAGAGMAAAVRKLGKKPHMIYDPVKTSSPELIEKLSRHELYEGCFITEEKAIELVDNLSLVIVVDTSRPNLVEGPLLLETVQRIAVIDHHRRAADYIENSAITMHETYASSACELVAELLQYIVSSQDVVKIEAEAMLSGIFLDTKNFTIKTGVRTFEAAAYLKQLGADTVEVRKLFSGDLERFGKKYELISMAKQVMPGVSISVSEQQLERAVAAQAADELINVSDIEASFVIYGEGEGSSISARSYGKVNVQVICEKIGGGGNMSTAGAQFKDIKPFEVKDMLEDVLREYLIDNPIVRDDAE